VTERAVGSGGGLPNVYNLTLASHLSVLLGVRTRRLRTRHTRRESFYLFGALVVWVSARRRFDQRDARESRHPRSSILSSFFFFGHFCTVGKERESLYHGNGLPPSRKTIHEASYTPFSPVVIVSPPRESSMTRSYPPRANNDSE